MAGPVPDGGGGALVSGSAPSGSAPVVRPGDVLCALDALDDPGSKAFLVRLDDGDDLPIFVVRSGAVAHAWVNDCPHDGWALDASTEGFLNRRKDRIRCMIHGATFGIDSGEMLSGPVCPRRWLTRVPIVLDNGTVRLAGQGLPRLG